MTHESAVQFATASRIHMGIAVRDLAKSIAFYRLLFGQEPTRSRPHYAKFEIAEPPVNLSLNENGGATGPNNPVVHFGIQVKSTRAVEVAALRLLQAGYETKVEDHVTCCYAVQNKVWVQDPDGNKWEIYVVLDNDPQAYASAAPGRPEANCCAGIPPIMEAVGRGDLPAAAAAYEMAGGMNACSCLGK
jgi:catechol 2,3-dioxygenase-like lactoylglutathione lyase family enzyme